MDRASVGRVFRRGGPLLVALLALPTLGIGGCEDARDEAPAGGASRDTLLPDEWANADRWIEEYGDVSGSHPLAARARRVYERLRPNFDDVGRRLVLLDAHDIETGAELPALAAALPDGNVVLNTAGLELCYWGVSEEQGDSRLALVLAHELAHLRYNHHWFLEAASMILPFSEDEIVRSLRRSLGSDETEVRKLELEADFEGILGMIEAGYDPEVVFHGDESFFDDWVATAAGQLAYQDDSHPTPEERALHARTVFGKAVELAGVFHDGVRAYEDGEYQAAADAFERVKGTYDGREVLSNLGLSYYQLAAFELGRCDGQLITRWRMPEALDEQTLLDRVVLRGSERSDCYDDEPYLAAFDRANDALHDALERDETYGEAILNFAALQMLNDRPEFVIGLTAEGVRLFPDDSSFLLADRTASFSLQSNADKPVDTELQALDDLYSRFPEDPDVAFNTAEAHWLAGDFTRAEAVWREFLELEPTGEWAAVARGWLDEDDPAGDDPDQPAK